LLKAWFVLQSLTGKPGFIGELSLPQSGHVPQSDYRSSGFFLTAIDLMLAEGVGEVGGAVSVLRGAPHPNTA
jgi:hypothetical protein